MKISKNDFNDFINKMNGKVKKQEIANNKELKIEKANIANKKVKTSKKEIVVTPHEVDEHTMESMLIDFQDILSDSVKLEIDKQIVKVEDIIKKIPTTIVVEKIEEEPKKKTYVTKKQRFLNRYNDLMDWFNKTNYIPLKIMLKEWHEYEDKYVKYLDIRTIKIEEINRILSVYPEFKTDLFCEDLNKTIITDEDIKKKKTKKKSE